MAISLNSREPLLVPHKFKFLKNAKTSVGAPHLVAKLKTVAPTTYPDTIESIAKFFYMCESLCVLMEKGYVGNKELRVTQYSRIIFERIDELVKSKKHALALLDNFDNFVRQLRGKVRETLNEKQKKGEVKDISQAESSIVGNLFTFGVGYTLIKLTDDFKAINSLVRFSTSLIH